MKKTLVWIGVISFFCGLMASSLTADSLWNGDPRFYSSSQKQVKVGDIITIFISEQTNAAQGATTITGKDSEMGMSLLSAWDQVANLLGSETIRKQYDMSLKGDDKYKGTGQTSRTSKVKAVVTALVTEVLDSGNLYIVGEHKVKVNNEVETIRISGIIRPQDIQANNSVLSSQIAKVEVSVNGAGVVGSKQSPGMLTKMFNWLF